jgi:hypothetical protein
MGITGTGMGTPVIIVGIRLKPDTGIGPMNQIFGCNMIPVL